MKRAYASREPDQSLLKPVPELIGGCTLYTAMQLWGLYNVVVYLKAIGMLTKTPLEQSLLNTNIRRQ